MMRLLLHSFDSDGIVTDMGAVGQKIAQGTSKEVWLETQANGEIGQRR